MSAPCSAETSPSPGGGDGDTGEPQLRWGEVTWSLLLRQCGALLLMAQREAQGEGGECGATNLPHPEEQGMSDAVTP